MRDDEQDLCYVLPVVVFKSVYYKVGRRTETDHSFPFVPACMMQEWTEEQSTHGRSFHPDPAVGRRVGLIRMPAGRAGGRATVRSRDTDNEHKQQVCSRTLLSISGVSFSISQLALSLRLFARSVSSIIAHRNVTLLCFSPAGSAAHLLGSFSFCISFLFVR